MYKFVGYLGVFMSAFFVAVGLFMAIRQFLVPPKEVFEQWGLGYFADNPAVFNYLVGSLLIAYGVFRFFRSLRIVRQNQL
jgi:hypothetical protein